MNKDLKVTNSMRTLGTSTHALTERQTEDFYATEPRAVELLCEIETFNKNIWEPACGMGHISKVLEEHGYNVKSTDLIDRGYGEVKDFLSSNEKFDGDIITNPPYKNAQEFIEKALDSINDGNKVAMFLKLQFLEGKGREQLYTNNPPKTIWVTRSRLNCAKNADPKYFKGSAIAYAWFIWEKGYKGDTVVKWFN